MAEDDSETTCSLCYAEFLDPEDLIVHFNQVHLPERSLHCQFCPSFFSGMDDYAVHIRDVHILSLMACKYCTKMFTDFDLLKKHEKKHIFPDRKSVYRCSQCGSKFSNIHSLQQHEMKNHDNHYDGILINKYFSIISSYLNIKALSFIQSLAQKAAYICTACVFTSPSPNKYIQHLKEKNCISVVCDNCCNVYKDKKGLTKHLRSHKECQHFTNKSDLKKTCTKCESQIDIYLYKDHIKKCKPIRCNLCPVFLNSVADMTLHQTTAHPMAITMTKCKLCHKEFVGNVAKQKHIDKKHKPEFHLYKYTCVYCEDMYFKHPQKLFCHFFSKHQDLQPYVCEICNMTFRVRKKFTIHIKMSHNSEGFVEFTDSYHVYFRKQKSEKPFQPKSLFIEEVEGIKTNETDVEQDDIIGQTDIQTDAPTDCPTDAPTDVEEPKKTLERKPPKIRFKEAEKSKEMKSAIKYEVKSEGNQTENEKEEMPKTKQKMSRKRKKKSINTDVSDSDDEPLIKIKKSADRSRGVKSSWNFKKKLKGNKKQFTCNICKKYCYTYQNYNHHMSMHFKDEVKKCIKCSKNFSSKTALDKHIIEKHTTSKLTETLKNLLERRKVGKNGVAPEMTPTEKFRRTIKKVKSDPTTGTAKITEISDKLSVKNFIETFTPEESLKKEKNCEIQNIVTVKTVRGKMHKPPSIKMTKFVPKPYPTKPVKLAMPVRFKPVQTMDKPKLKVKVVQSVYYNDDIPDIGPEVNDDHHQYDYEEETHSIRNEIPEVAQEVMLETQEQQQQEKKPVTIQHKIVLPEILWDSTENDIKIAHLLPVAPYYKIVKMKDVMQEQEGKETKKQTKAVKRIETDKDEVVRLPGGTKLVNVNPLAHLIGNTPIENLVGGGSKYYKPKTENFEKAVAKALLKLETARQANRRGSRNNRKTIKKQENVVGESVNNSHSETVVEIEQ